MDRPNLLSTELKTFRENSTLIPKVSVVDIQEEPEDTATLPKISLFRLSLVILGLFLSVLLVTLDHTIVATALPRIASSFSALQDATWIVTAYYLTQGGLMLTVGQILRLCSKKSVFLVSIAVFEIGSLIAALSPSMPVLILGRAIAGCGAAGFDKILFLL
ncbi:hypothetical protein Clacol_004826 [Clathrus columnatus]|uniref:Major facilitator superfamily (MFS) profile domain-containing protein n=1 Tax=Clathrus columnatus TaxID=1419009 RepID=A0AAV5AD14_9AGAM|nr:hypothetical protein Clacol_004826 [Clathrus columnatus]